MFSKIVVFAALACVAVAQDAVPQCSTSDALAVNKIEKPAADLCRAETNFRAVPPTGTPDDAQLTKMCASPNCVQFITGLKAGFTLDCEFKFPNTPVTNLLTIVKGFESNCQRLGVSPPGSSTTAPPPDVTTTAPPPATTAPPPSTTSPPPTTTAPPPTTTAPPPTTTAPPPTTTAPPPKPTPTVQPHC